MSFRKVFFDIPVTKAENLFNGFMNKHDLVSDVDLIEDDLDDQVEYTKSLSYILIPSLDMKIYFRNADHYLIDEESTEREYDEGWTNLVFERISTGAILYDGNYEVTFLDVFKKLKINVENVRCQVFIYAKKQKTVQILGFAPISKPLDEYILFLRNNHIEYSISKHFARIILLENPTQKQIKLLEDFLDEKDKKHFRKYEMYELVD